MMLAELVGGQTNIRQGYFAESFVASIAAAAAIDVQRPQLGHRIDLGVFLPGPKGSSGSKQINLQVKSWSSGHPGNDGCFHYPLEVKAFNYLAMRIWRSFHDSTCWRSGCSRPRSGSVVVT